MNKTQSKVGSGRNITKISERSLKKGRLLFIEGESSSEMFIVRSGKIRILKQEGENTIELAVLGTGSVLGELSLLDHQPRSATGQVIEDTVVTVINEAMFVSTMNSIPVWLANIIQVIVKRLRDTMKKTSDSIVDKSIAGVIKIILLLHSHDFIESEGEIRVLLNKAKDVIASTIGIGNLETENALLHLILKEHMLIRRDCGGREYILICDKEVLLLYMNYLRMKQRGVMMLGENLTQKAADLMKLILLVGENSGRIVKPGVRRVGIMQIEIELQRRNEGMYIDLDAVDELVDSKIIFQEINATKTGHQTHKNKSFIYSEKTLRRLILLHRWMPNFREDVKF